jgi:LuxR family maltose regulon positive regulatory protein
MFPQTKFHPPPKRAEHVERQELLESIARSDPRVLVVSAPAGFGKSTLLAQWAAKIGRLAWVSLDEEDRGPRFWLAVLGALRPVFGATLDHVSYAADAADVNVRERILVPLIDALAQAPPATLVLDDVHAALADEPTRASLDWLLARLPDVHRVAIATRRDPSLEALTRLRSHGDAFDVRADDLRFAHDESARFLRDGLGLTVDARALHVVATRTDGWPAAVYLAGLRMRRGKHPETVANEIGASAEALIGDLIDETLSSSPEHERRLVLETSLLRRFNLDLCLRLLGDTEQTRAAFASLTRSSLLLTPLDTARSWFSCHQLLRDALRNRLLAEDPARARELRVRAGGWLESEGGEGELVEAMFQYLAAGEWDLAAELLACHSLRFVQAGALGDRAREWLASFPGRVVLSDARLCYVTALLAALGGDRERRDGWLANGEAAGWLGPMPDGTASYALAATCLNAMLCFDDLSGAVAAARQSLARLPRGAPVRAAVEALTAWHLHLLGRGDEACRVAEQALSEHVHLPASGLPLVAYLPRAVLALVALDRGETARAEVLVNDAVAARDSGPLRASPHTLPVNVAQARLLTERGEVSDAIAVCTAGMRLAGDWRDPSLMVPALALTLARAQVAAGDGQAARRTVASALARLEGAADAGTLPASLAASIEEPAEGLSSREVEVLLALGGPGSLQKLADDLFISRNTIKTHTRALYSKLGVASRADAVRRGAELGVHRKERR